MWLTIRIHVAVTVEKKDLPFQGEKEKTVNLEYRRLKIPVTWSTEQTMLSLLFAGSVLSAQALICSAFFSL